MELYEAILTIDEISKITDIPKSILNGERFTDKEIEEYVKKIFKKEVKKNA